jgi:OOP family OmpA-OmpF porin
LLGACAGGQQPDENVSEVRALPQVGNEFQKSLHHEYVTLAQIELDEHHWFQTSTYNGKARRSAAGDIVLPTRMDERTISEENVPELTAARATLMRVLAADGATLAPKSSARAQTQFDCWIEEQEENIQSAHIALCRNGFQKAVDEASGIVFAAATPAPAATIAETVSPTITREVVVYTFYFDHDSSALDVKSLALKNDIAARVKSMKATSVTVNGYTDRSGERAYNRLLAERRATVVSDALVTAGVKPAIGSISYGEDRSAVETADNVREGLNRRVIVTLKN